MCIGLSGLYCMASPCSATSARQRWWFAGHHNSAGQTSWTAHQVWEQAAQDGTAKLHSNPDTTGHNTARRGARVTHQCVYGQLLWRHRTAGQMLQRLLSVRNSQPQQLQYLSYPVAHRPLCRDLFGAQAPHCDGRVQVAPCSKQADGGSVIRGRCRMSRPTICCHQVDRLGIAQNNPMMGKQ